MEDQDNKVSPVGYILFKSRIVFISVLGAKPFGLSDMCHSAIVIQQDLNKSLAKKRKIQELTDSETLFTVIISNALTTEKRLMIDVKSGKIIIQLRNYRRHNMDKE